MRHIALQPGLGGDAGDKVFWVRSGGRRGDFIWTPVQITRTSGTIAYAYKLSDPTKHERRIPLRCLHQTHPVLGAIT